MPGGAPYPWPDLGQNAGGAGQTLYEITRDLPVTSNVSGLVRLI
ncbi:MAG: hypothetical protein ACRDNZ_12555 [Streptosporangiaceae bacterium]